MVVNAAQLASYSQAKQGILDTGYIQVRKSRAHDKTLLVCFFRTEYSVTSWPRCSLVS